MNHTHQPVGGTKIEFEEYPNGIREITLSRPEEEQKDPMLKGPWGTPKIWAKITPNWDLAKDGHARIDDFQSLAELDCPDCNTFYKDLQTFECAACHKELEKTAGTVIFPQDDPTPLVFCLEHGSTWNQKENSKWMPLGAYRERLSRK